MQAVNFAQMEEMMRLKRKLLLVISCFLFTVNQGLCADSAAESLQLDSALSQEQPEELLDMQMPEMQDMADNKPTSNNDHQTSHQMINNTSLNNLSAYAWKIVGIRGAKDFHFKSDNSVFVFAKDLKFKAFLACNSIHGRYEADGTGKFLLRDLTSSNKACNDSRDQEVLIESMLLAVDGYFIDNQTLYLGSKGKLVLAFAETSKSINVVDSQKNIRGKSKERPQRKYKKFKGSTKSVVGPKIIRNKAQESWKTKANLVTKAKSPFKVKASKKK